MHCVHEPHDRRELPDQGVGLGWRQAARIRKPAKALLQAIELGDAFRRTDHEDVERAPFVAPCVLEKTGALGRRGGERLQVGNQSIGWGNLLAKVVAEHLFRRRDSLVVGRARRQFQRRRRLGGHRLRCGRQQESEQHEFSDRERPQDGPRRLQRAAPSRMAFMNNSDDASAYARGFGSSANAMIRPCPIGCSMR